MVQVPPEAIFSEGAQPPPQQDPPGGGASAPVDVDSGRGQSGHGGEEANPSRPNTGTLTEQWGREEFLKHIKRSLLGSPPTLKRLRAVGANAERLEATGWLLPMPRLAKKYEARNGCKVQPHESKLEAFLASPEWARSADGHRLSRSVLASSDNLTRPVIISMFQPRELGDWLLRLRACHAARLGVRPLLFVANEEIQQSVNAIDRLTGVHLPLLWSAVQKQFRGSGPNYMKWAAALATLHAGAPSVLVVDIDMLLLQDPRVYLEAFGEVDVVVSHDAQLRVQEFGDILDTPDVWEVEGEQNARDEHVSACCRVPLPYNAGQIYFKGSRAIRLLGAIISAQLVKAATCNDEQNAMMWAVFRHCQATPSRCRILDPRLFVDAEHALASILLAGLRPISPLPYTVHMDTDYKKECLTLAMETLHDPCLASV